MPVPFLKLVRLEGARLAAMLQAEPAQARNEAFERAFPGALGAACFGDPAQWARFAEMAPRLPLAPAHMARLVPASRSAHDSSDTCFEIWQCDAVDLANARHGPLHYRFSESAGIVFGSVEVYEEVHARVPQASGETPLERATYAAYEAIFSVLDALDMRHPLRIWNVVPAINAHQFGSERYRQFNTGRQRAFKACGRPVIDSVPAASALGSAASLVGDAAPATPLSVSFLASRSPSRAIENPRQISAYRYPARYGPSAPTFARAAAWRGPADPDGGSALFVSGTASIVGHETAHHGDVIAQLRETLVNIETVLEEAARQTRDKTALAELTYKVYVRDANDAQALAAIDEVLRARCGSSLRVLYLHADVCRADLLLEIEASGGHPVEVFA